MKENVNKMRNYLKIENEQNFNKNEKWMRNLEKELKWFFEK